MNWIDITDLEDTGLLDESVHKKLARELKHDALEMEIKKNTDYHFNELIHYAIVHETKILAAGYGTNKKRIDAYEHLKIGSYEFMISKINNRLLHVQYKLCFEKQLKLF